MFLRNLSFIVLLSSALRLENQEYNEIECLVPVSLPRMTVKTPSSMLILITVLRDTSGEITDRQSMFLRQRRVGYHGPELARQSLVEPVEVFVPPVDLDVAQAGSDGIQHVGFHPSELGPLRGVSNLAGEGLSRLLPLEEFLAEVLSEMFSSLQEITILPCSAH